MKIELTKEEAALLSQLIDLAVKAHGLNVASAAILINNKLIEASRKEQPNG